jgi:hypothetical protein
MANVTTTNLTQTPVQPKPSTFKPDESTTTEQSMSSPDDTLPFTPMVPSSDAYGPDESMKSGALTHQDTKKQRHLSHASTVNPSDNMPNDNTVDYTPPAQPWDRITAFLDEKRVFLPKQRKVEMIRNTWVAPADVMNNPSWRAIWEDREKQALEKDATINGLVAAASLGLGLPVVGNLLSSGHPHLVSAAALIAAPFYLGAQALGKLNKLDEIKDNTGMPVNPDETEGTVKLTPQQVQELQTLINQQQEQIDALQAGKRPR